MSANSALRAGTRRPRALHAPARSTPTCHGAVAAPVRLASAAVVVYPPTATARRRPGSSASAPPPSRARPARPSDTLDQPQRGGRCPQRRGQQVRQQCRGHLVAHFCRQARGPDPRDTRRHPPRLSRLLDLLDPGHQTSLAAKATSPAKADHVGRRATSCLRRYVDASSGAPSPSAPHRCGGFSWPKTSVSQRSTGWPPGAVHDDGSRRLGPGT